MCLLVFQLNKTADRFRLLAVRDEFLDRATTAPGRWWGDLGSSLVGVQDRLAGGTNLAVDEHSGAVAGLVNQPGPVPPQPASRGWLALRALAGDPVDAADYSALPGFHLLLFDGHQAIVTSWDGENVVRTAVTPGWHTLSRGGLDVQVDPREDGLLDRVRQYPASADWTDPSQLVGAERLVLEPFTLDDRLFGTVEMSLIDTGQHGTVFHHRRVNPVPTTWDRVLPGPQG
ncbi:MAG: NRDE family protein [Propionibacteriaceae bacterium]|jgi:uncharacterized protein with NRDE domain|nr:NRDE family protein [Propionibacteriaceae bacterium]